MFARLFADNGLSLDRLRALLEVRAAGSIAKAAAGDPVKQSQYSRQIKELEDFFAVKLMERHGKGVRLTPNGMELARISRFFLLGLSNFQRGCLAEEQTFCIGGSATFIRHFLLPILTPPKSEIRFAVQNTPDDEIERRLHDLTLDFGIVTSETISRPLQLQSLRNWELTWCVPAQLHFTLATARTALKTNDLSTVLAAREVDLTRIESLKHNEPALVCDSFLEASSVCANGKMAALLPDFLLDEEPTLSQNLRVPVKGASYRYAIAWNPRLLRLNPHATRTLNFLVRALADKKPRKNASLNVRKTIL